MAASASSKLFVDADPCHDLQRHSLARALTLVATSTSVFLSVARKAPSLPKLKIFCASLRSHAPLRASSEPAIARQIQRRYFPPLKVRATFAPPPSPHRVVGVGMTCAQTCLAKNLLHKLALVDVHEDKLRREAGPRAHASLPPSRPAQTTPLLRVLTYAFSPLGQGSGRARTGSPSSTTIYISLFKNIIPKLVPQSPNAIFIIVPTLDILAYASWRLFGFPPNRGICLMEALWLSTQPCHRYRYNLNSSRHWFLADKSQVNAPNIHGYMVGQQGDNSVPLPLLICMC